MVPPVPNFLKWMQIDPRRCGMVDYAGVANRWLIGASGGAVDLGTEVTGAITERALADGTSEVHVRLRTENALAWVVDGCDIVSGALQFGNRAQDVLAGARPSLASAELDVRYVDVAFGSPLRDIGQVLDFPHPGQGFKSASFRASADGELRAAYGVPEGTPGQAHFTLAVLFFTSATYGSAMSDGVPIDRIDLNVTGR
jgi:hypothetical protein